MEEPTKIMITSIICFTVCVIAITTTLMFTNGSYTIEFEMDNNTLEAMKSIDYKEIANTKECPFCPCEVFMVNESTGIFESIK